MILCNTRSKFSLVLSFNFALIRSFFFVFASVSELQSHNQTALQQTNTMFLCSSSRIRLDLYFSIVLVLVVSYFCYTVNGVDPVDISLCIPSNSQLALTGKCSCYNRARGTRVCAVTKVIDLVCTDLSMIPDEGLNFVNVTCL